MLTRRTFVTGVATMAALPAQAQQPEKLRVIASFSILADLTAQVAGARASVSALVGPGADAHVYSPTPADAKALAAARLVVVNGLKFEGWMDRLISASKTKAPIVVASKGVTTLRADDDHGHGDADPHAWQSIANARIYVANIRDGLIGADPAGKADYEANASAYLLQLDALEMETKAAVATIAPQRRKIISSHDAFGYFAAAYGLTFIAPQGVSTSAAASAQDVARIIRQIRRDKIPAIFVENLSDPRLAQRIAAETGAKLGGDLYSDQLSPPDGPAGTYINMVRHNIRELTKALAD